MGTKYILAALAVLFLVLGAGRAAYGSGRPDPQAGTWLLIAAIFGGVSIWLFYSD